MPILADPFAIPLSDDEVRYAFLQPDAPDFKYSFGTMSLIGYLLKDETIEDTELLLLYDDDTVLVYSCYFKVAHHHTLGERVVQVEVRSTLPGLARDVMANYFLKHYDSIRCDIQTTMAGLRMWDKFVKSTDFHFYVGWLGIDSRTAHGLQNQNANQPETFDAFWALKDKSVMSLQDTNRLGSVSVIYATNASIL
jgi:hypothetical protein